MSSIQINCPIVRDIRFYSTKSSLPALKTVTEAQEIPLYAVKDATKMDDVAPTGLLPFPKIGEYHVRFTFSVPGSYRNGWGGDINVSCAAATVREESRNVSRSDGIYVFRLTMHCFQPNSTCRFTVSNETEIPFATGYRIQRWSYLWIKTDKYSWNPKVRCNLYLLPFK